MSDWIDDSFEEITCLDHLAAADGRLAVFDLESNRA